MKMRGLVALSSVVLAGVSILVSPARLAYADVPDPSVYAARLYAPVIPSAIYGLYQTALKAGDTFSMEVDVRSAFGLPDLTADFSSLGYSNNATTTGAFAGYGAPFYPGYYFVFGPFTVSSSTPDGLASVPFIATSPYGQATASTTQVIIDNVPPTVSLTSITFSTDAPADGDYMYISGSANGTGSAVTVASVVETLLGPDKEVIQPWQEHTIGYGVLPFNEALATSTDGSFKNIPVQLFEAGIPGEIEAASFFRIDISVFDQAGNVATTSLTIPVPHPAPPDPCVAAGDCVSNVLFLPGIEGSRLYEGTGCGKTSEEKLWDPLDLGNLGTNLVAGAGDAKVGELALNASGESACSDIYTKEGDVVDSVGGSNIYKSFIDEMDGLKSAGTINDWEPVAYDWRLSLDDLLNNGAEHDGKIYYEQATSTPYILQTLRALAASSKTGKVTIVAHSNGGLLAKALLEKLGDAQAASLVDKVIMVGAPQSGAPEDLGATLFGYDAGIYASTGIPGVPDTVGIPIVSDTAARALAQNSPMAYHLLPSEDYLESTAGDAAHPLISFSGDAYPKEEAAYGKTIGNRADLDNFLTASEGGRTAPDPSDLNDASVLSPSLLSYANTEHDALDGWTPPAGIEVDQIAGWGVDTVAGVDFYTLPAGTQLGSLGPEREYRPTFIEDGDGIVPTPSALLMASSANVSRYWLDLHTYDNETHSGIEHSNLFEVPELRDFIKNILENSTITLPSYISTSQPPSIPNKNELTFFLHSPLTLQLTDSSGDVTGLAPDGSVSEGIPGSTYGQFGEVKYVTVPEGDQYQLTLHGQSTGTFSLDIQESSGDTITDTSTIAGVPTTASTVASLAISDGVDSASPLTVDEDGDGSNVITVAPVVGETVNYVPPAPLVATSTDSIIDSTDIQPPAAQSSGGGSGGAVAIATTISNLINKVTSQVTALPSHISVSQTQPSASRSHQRTSAPIAQVSGAEEIPVVAQTTSQPIFITDVATGAIEVASTTPSPQDVGTLQTASVYDASQQLPFTWLGNAFYTIWNDFCTALQKFF